MQKTLLLNADYTILHVCNWQKAIILLYVKEVAVEVDFYIDTKIKASKRSYPIPAVIALKKYVKHDWKRKKKFSRATVYKRDSFECVYCGVKKPSAELTLDHVIPRKKFQSNENPTFYENVVTSCKPCNAKKADKSCDEARMWPSQKPYTPMYYDIILGEIKNVPNEWLPYMPNRGTKK